MWFSAFLLGLITKKDVFGVCLWGFFVVCLSVCFGDFFGVGFGLVFFFLIVPSPKEMKSSKVSVLNWAESHFRRVWMVSGQLK